MTNEKKVQALMSAALAAMVYSIMPATFGRPSNSLFLIMIAFMLLMFAWAIIWKNYNG